MHHSNGFLLPSFLPNRQTPRADDRVRIMTEISTESSSPLDGYITLDAQCFDTQGSVDRPGPHFGMYIRN
jgi:hypothetical protein